MTTENSNQVTRQRLVSLDALRGFDMFFILAGGGGRLFHGLVEATKSRFLTGLLPQFKHGHWIAGAGYGIWGRGFVFWDIIMPLFLFCSGTSMPYSFSKFLARGGTKTQLYIKVLKRVLILFILGMIKQGNLLLFDLGRLHIYSNTLQAIGMGYLLATIIYINFNVRWQIIITSGLLLLFWALLALVPVPGKGAGVILPDSNFALYVDHLILGRFEDGLDYTWTLSSLTFACTVMLGVFAGQLVRKNMSDKRKVLWLFGIGAGSVIAGLLWSPIFPIIKYIWSSSMVLYSGGWCFILLGLFYLLVDVLGYKKWAFVFVVIGTNAIVAYMGEKFFRFDYTAKVLLGGLDKWLGNWAGFCHSLLVFGIVWMILYIMYKNRVFIKV